ncbi:MAG: transposase, partial [Candidatus Paceibacterota bacterium]
MSTFTNLRVHFIWSTKDREPRIREEFQADLYAYIGGILRERRHVLLGAGGVADHIHFPPDKRAGEPRRLVHVPDEFDYRALRSIRGTARSASLD